MALTKVTHSVLENRYTAKALYPDLTNAEAGNQNRLTFDSDGFTLTDTGSSYNASGRKYIYYAVA